ncbi:MAG: HD domain-containing protein [Dehalococcoidia bacterium]
MKNVAPISGLPEPLAAAIRRSLGDGGAVYVVGGYVRDRLLGRPTLDIDITVGAEPAIVAKRLASTLDAHVFPLSQEHGAWRVTPRAASDRFAYLDITRIRGSIDDDLHQRDFTMNAIAIAPEGGSPIDPFGGIEDIGDRRLRLVSDSAVAADPLRALRAVRFATELEFTLDDASAAIIAADADQIRRTSGERQRDEIARIFDTPHAADGIRLLDRLNLLDQILPELIPAKGCVQPAEHHYWDVFNHSVETVAVLDCLLGNQRDDAACRSRRAILWRDWPVEFAERAYWDAEMIEGRTRRTLLKLTGLLHDVSKPETRTVQEDGRVRFFGHSERGSDVAGAILRRLKFSHRETKAAELLVREHLRPGQLAAVGQQPTPRALYRLFRDLGGLTPELLVLFLADGAAAAGPRQSPEQWAAHVAYTGWILRQRVERETLVKPQRLVTGHDLIAELGMAPGPALGRVLDELTEAEAAGEITTRDQALHYARSLLAGGS